MDREAAAAALIALAWLAGCGGETPTPAEPGERAAAALEERSTEVATPQARAPVQHESAEEPSPEREVAATLTGVVLTPGGEPLAGVEVSTSVPFPGEEHRFLLSIDDVTDGAGRFELVFEDEPPETLDVGAEDPEDRYFGVTRRDVASDVEELELRLVAYREVEVFVRGVAGEPVEAFYLRLIVDHDGASIWTGEDVESPDGSATVRIPELPFEIAVESPAHEEEERGPFDLATFPERIDFVLAELAAISGRVMWRGAPVEGASVVLVRPDFNPLDGIIDDYTTGLFVGSGEEPVLTDAAGRFRVPERFDRFDYCVLASAPGHADGLSAPVPVGTADVEVELLEGGALRGHVRLADGSDPTGLEVVLYRELAFIERMGDAGQVHRARVAEDDTYRFEYVRPGPWLAAIDAPGEVVALRRREGVEDLPFQCGLTEGATTTLDLEPARDDDLCRLRGRVTIGGEEVNAYVDLLTEGELSLEVHSASVGEGGEFELAVRTPGRYRIVWKGEVDHYTNRIVTDVVELTPGETLWERDVPAERWVGEGVSLGGD